MYIEHDLPDAVREPAARIAVSPSTPAGRAPIVVVGGGAAGLELVTRLARDRKTLGREVVLVDRGLAHIWKPRLHEIATAMQSQSSAENSFVGHATDHHYRFEPGVLLDVDPAANQIVLDELVTADGAEVLPRRRIAYSTLVLALGSEENDFGTPGARAHCLFLNTPEQAGRIRDALLAGAFRVARGRRSSLSIVVVGGGATGVELAAEIKHAIDAFRVHEPELDAGAIRLTIVEASNRLLGPNPPEVSEYAAASLRARDVDLVLGERVIRVDADGLQLGSGRRLDTQLCIWTAGIRGPRAFEEMPALPRTRASRVEVDGWLRCRGLPNVYAIGDCAEWIDPALGRAAPYTAQVASAQAKYLAQALRSQAIGKPVRPFSFESAGAIVSLADRGAAGNLTSRFGRRSREHLVQGFSAQLLYSLLYRRHEFAILGWRRAFARVLTDWLGRAWQPDIKLH